MTEDLTIRASAVIATQVVEEMRTLQHTYPIPTVAVGRTMIGALLMASQLKQDQEVSLFFQGNGPLQTIFAEASFEGKTRAYTANPQFQADIGEKIFVGPAIGIGLLTVTQFVPTQTTPQKGTVIIRTGEIGDDIAFYLDQSFQIPSVVALGVQLDVYGKVEAAGGVLIELMPGADEASIGLIEKRVQAALPVTQQILSGAQPVDLVKSFLADFKLIELDHDYPIKYECRCNVERVKRSLTLLGLDDIDEILSENKPVEVTCEFCGRKYEVPPADVAEIRQKLYRNSLN